MNRFFCIFVTLSIFYLINQPNFVHTSSSGSWGSGASKLNLGVWIPPMTLRLPKFNMPKIKISATIKPRKNQPPMKIHLPEMSLNAKALGDDDNHGGGSYGGSSGGSYGGSGSYSGGGGSYSGGYSSGGNDAGYSSGGGDSYSSGGGSYSSPSDGYSAGAGDYSSNTAGGYGYRASASNQQQQQQQNSYQAPPSSSDQYQSSAPQSNNNYNSNQNNNDYNRYQPAQQDQRNAYYVDNQQSISPARYGQMNENVSYGASNSVQSGYRQPTERNNNSNNYRATSSGGSVVAPLSNYQKREKGQGNSAYGYSVNSNYARFARH